MNLRRVTSKIMLGLISIMGLAALSSVVAIVVTILYNGLPVVASNFPGFLVETPPLPGEAGVGGIGPSLLGTGILVALSSTMAIPLTWLAAVYMYEYPNSVVSRWARILSQVLVEFPTILVGLTVFTILVLPMKSFSALAGATALAIVTIPYMLIQMEETYKAIPQEVREAAYSLGLSKLKVNLIVLRKVARSGLLTAMLIGAFKAMGETAPLLFTAFGNRLGYFAGLDKPVDAIPLLIYVNAISPYDSWRLNAWGAAAVLLIMTLAIFITLRRLSR